MKPVTLIIALLLCTCSVRAQQFLWSTQADSSFKHISMDQVHLKIMSFYDMYEYYFDGTGYSKQGFFKMIEDSRSFVDVSLSEWKMLKNKILETNQPTVYAIKNNTGDGSFVLVFVVNKNSVNMIKFANHVISNAQNCSTHGREKFSNWLKTIIE